MSLPLTDVPQTLWGRKYPTYCPSYDNESVAMPLLPEKVLRSRVNTFETINLIYTLGNSHDVACEEDIASRITFLMLLDVFEMTKVPQHLHFIAEPRFVSGFVSLMASVVPSVSFPTGSNATLFILCSIILPLSLFSTNTVMFASVFSLLHLLKRANCLDETIRMSVAPTFQRLPAFWDASALLVCQTEREVSHLGSVSLVQMFEKPVLDRLLQLLNGDRKILLIVLKRTSVIGLSGLILTIFRRLVGTEVPYGYHENPDRFTNIILPYSRVLWRYLLLPPFSDAEEMAITDLHNLSSVYARLNEEKLVDVEDARNVLQEFNKRLGASKPLSVFYGTALIRFVAPLVSPGCEDLVPNTVKLSIQMLWNSLVSDRESKEVVRCIITGFLLSLRDMIKALQPRSFAHQPWIWQIVDHVVRDDLVDLVLRAMLTAPDFNVKKFDHQESQLLSATIEFMLTLSNLAPHPDFFLRFYDSGSLGDWSRDFDNPKAISALSPNWTCGEIIAGAMDAILGKR